MITADTRQTLFLLNREEVVPITIQEAVKAVLEIQQASGSNAKKAVIQKYAEDETFRRLLYYALNPMLTYNVSESTLRVEAEYDQKITLTFTDIFTICETLSSRRGLSDVTIYQVRSFIAFVRDEIERDFYIQLLSKTLRLGVTAKTVNKVIPGLIPEWEVQQAYPIEKYPLKPGTEFWLTQKLNGTRATYYKGRLYARSGVPYEGLGHIVSELEKLSSILDIKSGDSNMFVFDGELTLKDHNGISDNEAFRIATGIINSDAAEKPEICYTIFDVLLATVFDGIENCVEYSRRRWLLNDLLEDNEIQLDNVKILPELYHGTDQSQIDILLDQMVREDKEGLMVNLDVPYQRKRHRGILKVKRFYTMDLPIIGIEQGSGRLAGKLGAFVLDYKGNEVRVGSGFSDEQRTEFWEARDLIGTLCEVKYKEISYDKKTGQESLQFPVFMGLRPDKNDVSYG